MALAAHGLYPLRFALQSVDVLEMVEPMTPAQIAHLTALTETLCRCPDCRHLPVTELVQGFLSLLEERARLVWQPIETFPAELINSEAWFYIVPKTADETWHDTSGNPILSDSSPSVRVGKYKSWGSLSKATHWMRYEIPTPPETETR